MKQASSNSNHVLSSFSDKYPRKTYELSHPPAIDYIVSLVSFHMYDFGIK